MQDVSPGQVTNEQVVEFIRTTLKLETLDGDAAMGKIRGWDSLGQVSLILALENFAGLRVPPDMFGRLTSVDTIVEFLQEEGVCQKEA